MSGANDNRRDREAVLFANEAFYIAFAGGDFASMDALWARMAPVSCIHPGWGAIMERPAIMDSWRDILGAPPPVMCRAPQVLNVSADVASVICYEDVGNGFLVATNLFVREEGQWRMIHHQAGPSQTAPAAADPEETRTVN